MSISPSFISNTDRLHPHDNIGEETMYQQQYADYSNPAASGVYVWEEKLKTSENLEGSTHPVQQQEPQDLSMSQAPTQDSSASQVHFQLPSSLPPDTSIQQVHPQQYPSCQSRDTSLSASTPPQPLQYRFETITEEDFKQAEETEEGSIPGSLRTDTSGRHSASRPPIPHCDTPSAPSTSGMGICASPARKRDQFPPIPTHPSNLRPAPSLSAFGYWRAEAGTDSPRAQQDAQELPHASRLQVAIARTSHASAMLPYTVGVPCPTSTPSRERILRGLSTPQPPSLPVDDTTVDAGMTSSGPLGTTIRRNPVQLTAHELSTPKQYVICADIHFSVEHNIITAMFELPGVKRDDLQIAMSMCPFSRVRHVRIYGKSVVVLPLQGYQVRERKFGNFYRVLAVPPETKPEDISARLEDGILTLKIRGRAPLQAARQEDVIIPIPQ